MAELWEVKPPGATKRYKWSPELLEGDSLVSYTASASGASIDASSRQSDHVILYISGGVAGTTAAITLTADTANAETLTETVYLPISADTSQGQTAADIIDFALRPVVGLNGAATTAETNDALEWLNDMLVQWRNSGADVGASLPLTTSSVLNLPDTFLLAIKANLRVFVAEQYGRLISPATALQASRGLQHVKALLLTQERKNEYY